MPSPVTVPALVFCRKTRPAPPVTSTTRRIRTGRIRRWRSRSRARPRTRPSSTISSAQKNSSIAADRRIFERSLEQRVQDVKAAAVGREPCALRPSCRRRTPTLTLPSGLRLQGQPQCSSCTSLRAAMGDEVVDHVLVAEPVAAGNGVVEVAARGCHPAARRRRRRLPQPRCGCASARPSR